VATAHALEGWKGKAEERRKGKEEEGEAQEEGGKGGKSWDKACSPDQVLKKKRLEKEKEGGKGGRKETMSTGFSTSPQAQIPQQAMRKGGGGGSSQKGKEKGKKGGRKKREKGDSLSVIVPLQSII